MVWLWICINSFPFKILNQLESAFNEVWYVLSIKTVECFYFIALVPRG